MSLNQTSWGYVMSEAAPGQLGAAWRRTKGAAGVDVTSNASGRARTTLEMEASASVPTPFFSRKTVVRTAFHAKVLLLLFQAEEQRSSWPLAVYVSRGISSAEYLGVVAVLLPRIRWPLVVRQGTC
jgi:hypothetical protein